MMNYINKVSEAVWTNNKDDLEKLAHKNGKAPEKLNRTEFGSARQNNKTLFWRYVLLWR